MPIKGAGWFNSGDDNKTDGKICSCNTVININADKGNREVYLTVCDLPV